MPVAADGDPAVRPLVEFANAHVVITLLIGIVFCTPLARRIGRWRDARAAQPGSAATVVLGADIAWTALVFVAASAFLAAGTYNPFIYFRF